MPFRREPRITRAQIQSARAALGWSAQALAEKSGVGLRTLMRLEQIDGVPSSRSSTLVVIQGALQSAGIELSARRRMDRDPDSQLVNAWRMRRSPAPAGRAHLRKTLRPLHSCRHRWSRRRCRHAGSQPEGHGAYKARSDAAQVATTQADAYPGPRERAAATFQPALRVLTHEGQLPERATLARTPRLVLQGPP